MSSFKDQRSGRSRDGFNWMVCSVLMVSVAGAQAMGGGGGALTSTEIQRQYDTVIFQDRDLNGTPDLLEDAVLPASRPFTGVPFAITGTIEAEQFDLGGPDVAYDASVTGVPRFFVMRFFCHESGRTV